MDINTLGMTPFRRWYRQARQQKHLIVPSKRLEDGRARRMLQVALGRFELTAD